MQGNVRGLGYVCDLIRLICSYALYKLMTADKRKAARQPARSPRKNRIHRPRFFFMEREYNLHYGKHAFFRYTGDENLTVFLFFMNHCDEKRSAVPV